ncbi:TIGR03545 family protein [Aliidiomarina halalkaliphila]|uniref:TIGR03545 family protein n=1 Tax=Aliidiomarina halalkaliphila TaxID=2593535 RepID=A0A552WZ62_9GAMM|nr:TIGR03545 family protein [Aliidiomarina halalkaliphila]TRW48112.1 TIGR03545 family protein [Aliidiomarina halalkaliphila]
MKNIIRWPGLIAFLVIVVGVAVVIRMFAGPLLKGGLEYGLTYANGAEVNIEQAVVRWSPFSLTLQGIEVTDPDQPELNRVQAMRAHAEFNPWDALIGRVHIHELELSGVAMGVERASPGRVRADYQRESDPIDWQQILADLNIDIPSLDEVLARSEIRTPELVTRIEQDFEQHRTQIETARENLPSRERIDGYRERMAEITETRPRTPQELVALRERLDELKSDIRADRNHVQTFVSTSEQAVQVMREDLTALREAPSRDLARIRQLLSFDQDSMSELSGVLFGPRVEQWSRYAFMAFDVIGPMLQRAEDQEQRPNRWHGRYIDFDRQSRPTFLVDRAGISIRIQDVDVMTSWQNITWQHDRIDGAPTTFEASSSATQWWNELRFDGEFALSELRGFSGHQNWRVRGVNLMEQSLLDQEGVSARLLGAVLNSEGRLGVREGRLDGSGLIRMQDVDMRLDGEARWARILSDVISQVNAFDMNLSVDGPMGQPALRLRSDLDNQLQQLLTSALRQEADAQLSSVRADLEQQVAGITSTWEPRLQQFVGLRDQAREQNGLLEELLSVDGSELSIGEQLEDRLRDSLRRRIGG